VFAYAGLLPWTFFANAISNSGNSLVGSANLINESLFPRIIIPAAAIAAGLVDLRDFISRPDTVNGLLQDWRDLERNDVSGRRISDCAALLSEWGMWLSA